MKSQRPLIGPDPAFPVLGSDERISFPDARVVSGDEPALWGANLSPGVLLSAYEQGFFPWYSSDQPLWWWSPDPRFVVDPKAVHCPSSMRRVLNKSNFSFRADSCFEAVISHCSRSVRPGQDGTWITPEMIRAYTELHRIGRAHSIEAWQDGQLAGGFYGVLNGRVFCGESMFTLQPNASKAAFLTFCQHLGDLGIDLIDSQVHTEHVERLGGYEIPRKQYLDRLEQGLATPVRYQSWQDVQF